MTRKFTPWRVLRETIFYLLLSAVGVFMALPFVWSLLTSLKDDSEIFSTHWLPTHLTLAHYAEVFQVIPYGSYILNSFVMAGLGVITNLFLGSLAGYAYARLRMKHKNFFFRSQVASMMIPSIITMIPTYLILRSFPLVGGNNILGQGGYGFLNTIWAVVLPWAVGSYAVFMMRQFFMTLPEELAEAARLDGCSEFRIFWNIYLPLCKPALATLAIFTFQAGWNSFLWPMIVLNDPKLKTVQMGLQVFSSNHSTNYGPMMAASIIAMLPMILIFVFAQRYFTQGVAFEGGK
ncbi:MAG: carbohydrate ABC transporter permease [Anaerolineaceae bacterium]|mgnify:CR=1 FL=1|jgi:multiple sugar transport system permease protein|nr:carbohydrate ABC transporter permease [Anaerolineaceae bacterium]